MAATMTTAALSSRVAATRAARPARRGAAVVVAAARPTWWVGESCGNQGFGACESSRGGGVAGAGRRRVLDRRQR